ncbi:MAG: HypC/HybG/HupF family hydrogenase formation chaperone [Methylococcaceae bacterium]
MCLAIPGQIVSMDSSTSHTLGRVRFGAIIKEINLYCTPEATVGDYVLVHAGLAITVLDQEEAQAVLDTFAEWDAT